MSYEIRPIRPEEWPQLKALRLAALADPVAPVAFFEQYEDAVALPDEVWEKRALEGSGGPLGATFVGITGGRLVGKVVVRLDGAPDAAMIFGVYTLPEHRGTGVARLLFEASAAWAWQQRDVGRMLLHVHERNPRAEAFYRRQGFVRTGVAEPDPADPAARAYEMVLRRPG